jgi:hypothetical protein
MTIHPTHMKTIISPLAIQLASEIQAWRDQVQAGTESWPIEPVAILNRDGDAVIVSRHDTGGRPSASQPVT